MSQLKEKLLSSFIAFEEQKNVDSYVHGIRTKSIKKFEKEGFPTKKNGKLEIYFTEKSTRLRL